MPALCLEPIIPEPPTVSCVSTVPILKKMKALKRFKKKMGLASRPETSSLPPLLFHPVCGDNVRIEGNGRIARRVERISFSNRSVKVGEKVFVKLTEISTNWLGIIRFGFTSEDPAGLKDSLPKSCPDLTSKPGYWAKALSERFAVEGCFVLLCDFCRPITNSYRSSVDVENLQPSLVQLALTSGMPRYYSSFLFIQFPFHRVKGRHVLFNENRTIVSRVKSEYSHGYVFTSRPLRSGENFVIKVQETETMYVGALAFGLTAANPAGLDSADLPEDCDLLLDRPEYWVVSKDVASSSVLGDELAFG
ncbi:Protein neuralized [Armadillidium nasatum]|uniref:Protein neuralized n=1 Tax=Armadillidium nasatum TaxID=96803 RepID=A0A5N5T8V4_9CRUS|nr:Protein neuralized [Armadillidium nasatum]